MISRCPTMYAAHARRLDILAKKWGGSNEEMLEFARGSADLAPAGDPLTAMVPLAHFEIGRSLTIEVLDAGKTADFLDICGDQLVRARAEIDAAADKWMLAIPRPHPRALEAHNVFAAAYCLMGDDDRTRSHLVGMRDHVDEMPWGYFTSDAGLTRRYQALYAQYVEKR